MLCIGIVEHCLRYGNFPSNSSRVHYVLADKYSSTVVIHLTRVDLPAAPRSDDPLDFRLGTTQNHQ